jgi:hypothetical protein
MLVHFDVIYWCSLTAAFRILISVILFANSALLFARVLVKTFHISIFPHSPRKLSSCLSHERRTTSNEKMSSQKAMVCLAARVCSSLLLLSFFSFVSSAQRNDDDVHTAARARAELSTILGKTSPWRTDFNTYDSYSEFSEDTKEEVNGQQQRSLRFRFFFSLKMCLPIASGERNRSISICRCR